MLRLSKSLGNVSAKNEGGVSQFSPKRRINYPLSSMFFFIFHPCQVRSFRLRHGISGDPLTRLFYDKAA